MFTRAILLVSTILVATAPGTRCGRNTRASVNKQTALRSRVRRRGGPVACARRARCRRHATRVAMRSSRRRVLPARPIRKGRACAAARAAAHDCLEPCNATFRPAARACLADGRECVRACPFRGEPPCLAQCRADNAHCIAAAGDDFQTCRSGCADESQAVRTACATDPESDACAAARDALHTCLQPCRKA
jgi:hypothetical protein